MAHAAGVWKHLCDRYHTTRPQPRLEEYGHYDTHVGDLCIAFELCHGLGEAYAQAINRAAIKIKSIEEYEDLDCDFLSEEEDRLWAKEDVMRRWDARADSRAAVRRKDLLMGTPCRLNQRDFTRLLR